MKKLLLVAIIGLSTMAMSENYEEMSLKELNHELQEVKVKMLDEVSKDESNHAVLKQLKDEHEAIEKAIQEKKEEQK